MICLRCGYCCIHHDVVILKDYNKKPQENNTVFKKGGEVCRHLTIDLKEPNKVICKEHHKKYFKKSPCDNHGQIEVKNSVCRLGEYIINSQEKERKKILKLIRENNKYIV
jgi:hypothetical protein